MGSMDPELQSLQDSKESKKQAIYWVIAENYVYSDVGLSSRRSDSLLDDEIKAYVNNEMHLC